jgi:CheY-like chemotaxis protein
LPLVMSATVVASGRVLIIEDDASVRQLVDLVLRDEGYTTAAAANGASALTLLETVARQVGQGDERRQAPGESGQARAARRVAA